ncbi:MAG TPA: FtsK/SpoIIIE domain-containing protein, partial [Polyangiaceae bacterium]|nr:FtsK/SpoIIIE domain-containing protein [Polyangiaceae bacterium]
ALDLGQAALYHLILSQSAAQGQRKPSALALVRFIPEREEILIDATTVAPAEARLLELIGELSGVRRSVLPREVVVAASAGEPAGEPPGSSYDELIRRLARAFREYGKSVEIKTPPSVGPRFLRFEAELGSGVKFEHVQKLAPEIGLRLGTLQDPIITRAQGRVLIDVPRPDPRTVSFEVVPLALAAQGSASGSSRLVVGVGVDSSVRFADLSDPNNAHVVVAGTTGSGKTEWLRSALASLLIGNTPETLRLVLIDPKQTAFNDLRGSAFLWEEHGFWVPGVDAPIVDVLQALVREMERRYDLLAQTKTDDLARYIEKTQQSLPRIVMFCDEYFSLVMQASRAEKKHIEKAVGLLGSKARAAGIHLVLAMQQASRRVLEGAISANFPCRVALLTNSDIESRMVIGRSGASHLTGRGDLLYRDIGEPVRLQAPYLDEAGRQRWLAGR